MKCNDIALSQKQIIHVGFSRGHLSIINYLKQKKVNISNNLYSFTVLSYLTFLIFYNKNIKYIMYVLEIHIKMSKKVLKSIKYLISKKYAKI